MEDKLIFSQANHKTIGEAEILDEINRRTNMEHKFKLGDVVQHKTGGPKLVVEGYTKTGDAMAVSFYDSYCGRFMHINVVETSVEKISEEE
jgi:uncharacterized protein YodC (DUF2158 family)